MQILFNNNQTELKKSTDILNDFIQKKESLVNHKVYEFVVFAYIDNLGSISKVEFKRDIKISKTVKAYIGGEITSLSIDLYFRIPLSIPIDLQSHFLTIKNVAFETSSTNFGNYSPAYYLKTTDNIKIGGYITSLYIKANFIS